MTLNGFVESAAFVGGHFSLAGVVAVIFFLGFASAWVVVRYDLRLLIRFPLWFVSRITRVVAARPHTWFAFVLIFGFNGVAMFVYMLSGVFPLLPAAVAFLTGMNIAIVLLKGEDVERMLQRAATGPRGAEPVESTGEERPPGGAGESASEAGPEGAEAGPGQAVRQGAGCLVALCFLIVMALELPCFWFSVAMGAKMDLVPFRDFTAERLRAALVPRIVAYLRVILPLLAVSAAAEAVAITSSLRPAGSVGGRAR